MNAFLGLFPQPHLYMFSIILNNVKQMKGFTLVIIIHKMLINKLNVLDFGQMVYRINKKIKKYQYVLLIVLMFSH